MKKLILIVVLCFIALIMSAQTNVTLTWDYNPTDGGYMVFYGTNSNNLNMSFDTGTNNKVNVITTNDFVHYYEVTAYNSKHILSMSDGHTNGDDYTLDTNGFTHTNFSPIVYFPRPINQLFIVRGDNVSYLSFTGTVGHSYDVQSSSDLNNWTRVFTTAIISSNTLVSVDVTNSANQQFYRTKMN